MMEKVHSRSSMASESNVVAQYERNTTTKERVQQQQPRATGSDLPIARRAALHRFFERTKDRAVANASYQVNPPSPAAPKPEESNPWIEGWKQDTLNLLFSPRDKELINLIHLCGKSVEDVPMWPFTPTGSYTVKFGYRFLYNSRSLDNGEYQPDNNRLWKKVWGMQVQPKNSVWDNTGPSPRFSCFKDLVETIIETGKDLNSFAIIVWAIWYRRNTMRASGKHVPVQQVHYEVQKARSMFIPASQPRPPEQMPHSVSRPVWKPPPWPKLKVNFDGAVFRENQRVRV
nr:protein tify 10a [Quercus suber]